MKFFNINLNKINRKKIILLTLVSLVVVYATNKRLNSNIKNFEDRKNSFKQRWEDYLKKKNLKSKNKILKENRNKDEELKLIEDIQTKNIINN